MNLINVSIILPVYNCEDYLDRCLVSLLRQTIKNYEIIMVDDGSTDHSPEIADSYASRFPDRVRVFHQENKGPSAARNLALSHARGKYVGFMDSDDWADTDMFLRLFLIAEQEPADLVICGRYDIITERKPFRYVKRTPNTSYPCSTIFESPGVMSDTTQFVWDKLFRRSIIEEHEIRFDERFRYTEDVLFLCVYKYYCNCIYTIPDPLYYHYQNDANPAAKYGPSLLDVPDVLEEIFAFYTRKGYFEPLSDVFFGLTAARLILRINRFPYMSGKDIQAEFCRRMYRVMKKYFPGWRKRIIFHGKRDHRGGLAYIYRGFPLLMRIYILLPNRLKGQFRTFCALRRQFHKKCSDKFTSLKKRSRKYTGLLLNSYYSFYLRKHSLKKQRVLFESKSGREPAGNMLSLLRESLQQKKTVYLALKKENQNCMKTLCRRYNIPVKQLHFVRPESFAFYRVLATAGYLFNDSAFPHRFVKREGQIYLNTWHGVPLKAMGCEVPGRAYAIGDVQRNFLQADYLLFPNPFMQEKMFHSYMLNGLYHGKVLQEAYPRVSILTDENRRSELRQELGLTNQRVFCYLPTWRGLMTKKQNTRQYADCLYFLRKLDRMLQEDMILYVKLHPYAQKGFVPGEYRHIRMFPDDYETYDFLTVCDTLITDYSSVFFDFAVSHRKIVLFAYDYEEYRKDRGLYLNLETLPFPLAYTVEELYHELCTPKSYDDTAFLQEYCPYDPKDTAARICTTLYQQRQDCRITEHKQDSLCLLYGELLEPGTAYTQLMQILSSTDYPNNLHLVTGVLSAALGEEPQRLQRLLTVSRFLSMEPDLYYTPLEALAYRVTVKRNKKSKLFDRLLFRLYQREFRRNFSTLHFSVILFCTEEDERYRRILQAASNSIFLTYMDGLPEIMKALNKMNGE